MNLISDTLLGCGLGGILCVVLVALVVLLDDYDGPMAP